MFPETLSLTFRGAPLPVQAAEGHTFWAREPCWALGQGIAPSEGSAPKSRATGVVLTSVEPLTALGTRQISGPVNAPGISSGLSFLPQGFFSDQTSFPKQT